MKSFFFILPVFLINITCRYPSGNTSTEQEVGKAPEMISPPRRSGPQGKGLKELADFEQKYESRWASRPSVFPYSKGRMIKVYQLDCEGDCFKAEFRKRISAGKVIPGKDLSRLVNILKDPASYDQPNAACHDPKFGLVVYDDEGVPMEFLNICMSCNSFRTYPGRIEVDYENEMLYGFSRAARDKLRQLFLQWEIDYYGFSPLWDDEEQYSGKTDKTKENVNTDRND